MKRSEPRQFDFKKPAGVDFPFEINSFAKMPRVAFTKSPKRTSFYEIFYVKGGEGEIIIDFEAFRISPPSVYFSWPGQVHSWQLVKPATGYAILFTGDFRFLSDINKSLISEFGFFHSIEEAPHLPIERAQEPVIDQLVEALTREYRIKQFGQASLLRAYLHILLIHIHRFYETAHGPDVSTKTSSLVRRFKRLVSKNFLKDRSVETYASRLGITPGHLRDTVKAATGMTPGQIIRNTLALEAKRLLVHTDMTVAEICYALSFEDPSYFGRFFKRETGLSPRAFREQTREKYQLKDQ
ncbi:MAG: helix-turn-helix domain-containing protein [Deltaproteobacteria bacterium]|nr:helix-turn-helix domain-containing protein [Deltaproteobacteria bacterium]